MERLKVKGARRGHPRFRSFDPADKWAGWWLRERAKMDKMEKPLPPLMRSAFAMVRQGPGQVWNIGEVAVSFTLSYAENAAAIRLLSPFAWLMKSDLPKTRRGAGARRNPHII